MKEQKPEPKSKDVEFSTEQNSVIREAFQDMYSQTGLKDQEQTKKDKDA